MLTGTPGIASRSRRHIASAYGRLRRSADQKAHPQRHQLRVDHLDARAAVRELLRRPSRVVRRRRELAGDMDRDDISTVGEKRLVRLEEVTWRRRGRRGQDLAPHELVVKEVMPDFNPLFVHLVPENHAQRNDRDPELARQVGRHIGRAVGDDAYGQTRAPFRRQYSSAPRSTRLLNVTRDGDPRRRGAHYTPGSSRFLDPPTGRPY